MSVFRAIFGKELRDALRDRRSLLAALIYPLVGPLMVVGMYAWMGKSQAPDRPVRVVFVGADHAPNFVDYLTDRGIESTEAPGDPEAALAAGDLDAIVEIPESFDEDLRQLRPVGVRVVTHGSRPGTLRAARRVERVVEGYGTRIGMSRLLLRGIDPRITRAVVAESVDLATDRGRAALVLGFLPMFIVLAGFVGGMYVATDASAGERERGSLEPLLLHPISRWIVAAAKWAATSVFSVLSVVLTAVAMWAAFRFVPLEGLGVHLDVGARLLGALVVMALPVAPMVAALQLLVGIFARSFKEAQTYLSLLMFLPMLVGVFTIVEPVQPRPWMAAVPVFGSMVSLGSVLRGEAPDAMFVATTVAVSALVTVAAIHGVAWLLGKERIVFGR
ncbi:MAG: ABC transporter permease [Deltaproteobacteria bacterium]|nr:MAG: ABC transporter permease [Deltaproteobacteria bacterium]